MFKIQKLDKMNKQQANIPRTIRFPEDLFNDYNKLAQDTLVVTVMSNIGLKIAAEEHDIKLATTKVGDRYVLEEMKKSGYNLGFLKANA